MVDTAILNWTLANILALVVIMIRVGPLIFLMPVIGSQSVPPQAKVLFTLMTSLVLLPVVPVTAANLPTTAIGLTIFVGKEMLFVAILALFAKLVFAAVESAGQMVAMQMGFSMAGVMDPQHGTQIAIIGFFWHMIAALLFLSVNGHHLFFRTLVETFTWVRPGGLSITQASYEGIIHGVGHMFVLAVKIMAPAGAVLFFSDVAMGILAKVSPQIPVMLVAMPMKIAIGFIFIGLSLDLFMPLMIQNFDMLGRLLPKLAIGLGG
ncbi:MAG: flagellar biosynthetic protein FliR [Desulfobulbaceae bacterium]|nr:flagellar biosynthetic protein FliR [Desulfobulbaceae bacterium]